MLWGFTALMIFGKPGHHLQLFAPVAQPGGFAVGGDLLVLFDCSAEFIWAVLPSPECAQRKEKGGCENTQSSILDAN